MAKNYDRREFLGLLARAAGIASLGSLITPSKSYSGVWMVHNPVGKPITVQYQEKGKTYTIEDVDGDGVIDRVTGERIDLYHPNPPYTPHSSVLEEKIRNQEEEGVDKDGNGIYDPNYRAIDTRNPKDPWFLFSDTLTGRKIDVFKYQKAFEQLKK